MHVAIHLPRCTHNRFRFCDWTQDAILRVQLPPQGKLSQWKALEDVWKRNSAVSLTLFQPLQYQNDCSALSYSAYISYDRPTTTVLNKVQEYLAHHHWHKGLSWRESMLVCNPEVPCEHHNVEWIWTMEMNHLRRRLIVWNSKVSDQKQFEAIVRELTEKLHEQAMLLGLRSKETWKVALEFFSYKYN